jgi:glyoxylase-like metal-dependent hydrolase (beta-lactamase superfamily II)
MTWLRVAVPVIVAAVSIPRTLAGQRLRLVDFTTDSTSLNVVSTLIMGPTESILIDAQFHMSDARRIADSIAALHTHLKAIFITHPDEDHYFGAIALLQRFPGTPIYATPRGYLGFRQTSQSRLAGERRNQPSEAPDSLVTPRLLRTDTLSVDGELVRIVPDLQGDFTLTSNSFVWIPSLRAVIAGDLVFTQVHAYLGAGDHRERDTWRRSLQQIAALHPAIVVGGHKLPGANDSPDVLNAMDRYLADFDSLRRREPNADSLAAAMARRYPAYGGLQLLSMSARNSYSLWTFDGAR